MKCLLERHSAAADSAARWSVIQSRISKVSMVIGDLRVNGSDCFGTRVRGLLRVPIVLCVSDGEDLNLSFSLDSTFDIVTVRMSQRM